MAQRSIRGAITANRNTVEDILKDTKRLLEAILKSNHIKTEDIISVIFTCTKDLDKAYPAVAARELGIVEAGLMCFQELYVEGSLEKCIRVMVNAETELRQSQIKHIYLKGAVKLRPDIIQNNEVD